MNRNLNTPNHINTSNEELNEVQNTSIESRDKIIKRELLNAKGINFNESSFLQYVLNGDADIVRIFLEAGIRPNAKNKEGKVALVEASKKGHKHIVSMLIEFGASMDELVDEVHQKYIIKKDIWDKLSALSSLATVIASILIAAIGWYFTQNYNKWQIEQNKILSDRDTAVKEHQNRILEMETIQKMIPHLTSDENSKRVALLAIRSLASSDLATQMAQMYPSEGSIQALQQIASSNIKEEKKQAVSALSNIAKSNSGENKNLAVDALSKIFLQLGNAAVKITVFSENGGKSIGTGIIVSKDGYILTADYLTYLGNEKVRAFEVMTMDNNVQKAELIDVDLNTKLAILKVKGENYKTITLSDTIPSINTPVISFGSIMGGPIKAEVGTVTGIGKEFVHIEFNNPMKMSGLGGGPVLDARGQAVGIFYQSKDNLIFSIRSDVAHQYLKSKRII